MALHWSTKHTYNVLVITQHLSHIPSLHIMYCSSKVAGTYYVGMVVCMSGATNPPNLSTVDTAARCQQLVYQQTHPFVMSMLTGILQT